MPRKVKFQTDIVMGEKYRDAQTGIEGTVVAVCFYQHACERVTLELVSKHDGKIEEYTFDAPRLTSVKTGVQATTTRTGGPRDMPAQPAVRR